MIYFARQIQKKKRYTVPPPLFDIKQLILYELTVHSVTLVDCLSMLQLQFSFSPAGCTEYQDIVFSLDRSGSIEDEVFEDAYNAVRAVVSAMNLDDGTGGQKEKVRVGVQTFTENQAEIHRLNNFGPLPALADLPDATGTLTDIVAALT